jgi:hypothetical protein
VLFAAACGWKYKLVLTADSDTNRSLDTKTACHQETAYESSLLVMCSLRVQAVVCVTFVSECFKISSRFCASALVSLYIVI